MNFCTASGLSSLGTSLGLSQTTAYTPYLPLLALSIATKWFHLCQINPHFAFITSNWFLGVVALLTLIDLIADLIPGVSTGWHALHTAITPFIGGFVAAATTSGDLLPGVSAYSLAVSAHSTPAFVLGTNYAHITLLLTSNTAQAGTISTILMFIVGFVLSGLIQLHRTGGRAVANIGHAFTFGLSNVFISLAEDVVAIVSIILSFLAPVFMLVVVIIIFLFVLATFRYILRGLRFLKNRLKGQESAV
ncbi:MAG TPA: DUF4126 domain-containing protein [Ktedonobacteraceae bacterium]|jgi:hypothetical protein